MKHDVFKNDPVIRRLRQADSGAFRKVVLKLGDGGKTIEGAALDSWLEPLLEGHYANEKFAAQIHYQLDTSDPLPIPFIQGGSGTVSPPELSFVYLDVGAWVGSKGKPWGDADQGSGEKLKRDFGVICGPLVALCSFTYAHTGHDCSAWMRANKSKEPYRSTQALLEKLSQASKELGKVVVRDVVIAPSVNPRWRADPDDWIIHVIVGDMHIPVLDQEVHTYGGSAEIIIGKTTKPGLSIEKAEASDVVIQEVPERVPRLGRVDLPPLEDLVKMLVGPNDADGTKGLEKLIKLGAIYSNSSFAAMKKSDKIATGGLIGALAVDVLGAPALAASVAGALGISVTAASSLIEESWRRGDWKGIDEDTMSANDAKRWYEYYIKGMENGKPADIFEEAGAHFFEFMKGVSAYVDEHAEKDHLPVKFLQLGDMIDFWVGFTCHYEPSPIPDIHVKTVHYYGERMVKAWAANVLGHTVQGKHIAAALQLAENKGMAPEYLYGNHDNYLGANIRVLYPVDGQKHPSRLARRKASYWDHGLFMEHGHQWEPANADSKSKDPIVSRFVMGTPSPLGAFVTQAAFIRPGPVRLLEGKAASLMARLGGTYGQRMDQIVGAAHRFWERGGGFYCYVMGHTHSACLSQVVLTTQYDGTIETFRKESEKNPNTRVFFTVDGVETKDVLHKMRNYGLAEVRVDWTDMLGSKENEWVSIEDPLAPPPGNLAKATKGLAMPNRAGSRGKHTFEAPPGLYVARFYLTREAREPFRESKQRIAVQGISIDGDPEYRDHPVFEFDRKFSRPIFIRWAYDPARFDDAEAFFALYRDNEPIASTSIRSLNPPHPIHKFVALKHNSPMYGRWCLSQAHPICWDFSDPKRRPYGVWIVRAFMDAAAKKPIGEAKLEVRQAHTKKTRGR